MKTRKKIHLLLTVCALYLPLNACVNKEESLLDLFPNSPIVSREVGKLINGNALVDVVLLDSVNVRGISLNSYFETPDLFGTINLLIGNLSSYGYDINYEGGGHYTARSSDHLDAFGKSRDYGRYWQWHALMLPNTSPGTTIQVAAVSPREDESYWVLARESNYLGQNRSLLMSYILTTSTSAINHDFGHYDPLTVHFANRDAGWALLKTVNQPQMHLTRTTDGGQTWSTPQPLATYMIRPKIISGSAEHLFIFDRQSTNTSLYSTDGGRSFAESIAVLDAQYITEDVIYALNYDRFYKSSNGAVSWENSASVVYDQVVGGTKLWFSDTNQGIVYGSDRVFSTKDGGVSWDIAVFPYGYVFE